MVSLKNEWADFNHTGIIRKKRGKYMPRLNTTLIRGVALTSAKKQTNKPNGKSKDKQCMIYGAGHNSEECKFLSYFGNKWSTTRPPKDHKYGNTNTG